MEPPPDCWEEKERGTAWLLVSGSLKALSHSPPFFQVQLLGCNGEFFSGSRLIQVQRCSRQCWEVEQDSSPSLLKSRKSEVWKFGNFIEFVCRQLQLVGWLLLSLLW